VVVAGQIRADAHAIMVSCVAALVGIVMLPWCILRALLRWPCKPVYWLWMAWRNPQNFDRLRQALDKAHTK
jgi:DNA-binding transcriptional LysR family regulator